MDADVRPFGMIDGVVNHLGKPEMANVEDFSWQALEEGRHVPTPDPVFCKAGERVLEAGAAITPRRVGRAGSTGFRKIALGYQGADMGSDGLSANPKLARDDSR
jgi:hypothetical protein